MDSLKMKQSLDKFGKVIKYSIFTVNFLLFLGGLTILGLAIWVLIAGNQQQTVLNDYLVSSTAILLTFGTLLTFITFLGCLGAIKEVKCLIVTYFVVLLIITILFVIGVTLLSKDRDKAEDYFIRKLKKSMRNYSSNKSIRDTWDFIQNTLQCCGVYSYKEWYFENWYKVPLSCDCKRSDECVEDYQYLYWYQGCAEKIKDAVKSLSTPLLAVAITVIIFLVLTMVCTCCLYLKL